MRNFLTFIAVALVSALVTALVAPPFIDWSARREMVAHAIAGRVGAPVRIGGAITLRLLPVPYLEAADIAFGPPEAPWLAGPSMRFEFGLASLLGGKIKLDDVEFDRPRVRLGPHLSAPADGSLEFGHVVARHAEVEIERASAASIALHDLSVDGAAPSARGPWRASGDFAYGQGRASFDAATEAVDGDTLPLKGDVIAGTTRVDLDGRLALAAAPAYAGTAVLSGAILGPDGRAWPWRVSGDLAAGGDAATMAQAELSIGEDARSLQAEGSLSLTLGSKPTLTAELKAKTLNFDALLRDDKKAFVSPTRSADALLALASRALGRDAALAAFSLKLAGDQAFVGARTLTAPRLALSGAPAGPLRLVLQSGLPGGGQVAVDGSLELGAAPVFRGHGEGRVQEFATLGAWFGEGEPALASRLAGLASALPAGEISAAGDVELSSEGYAIRGLQLGVAQSRFNGGVVFRSPSPERPGRLYLNLASDALDIEAAPNVEAGLDWLGDLDLDLQLKADALRVARVGLASLQGGSLEIEAKKVGQKFSLENLSVADLGGASIHAEGETSPSGRWTRVKLDAAKLRDFAALLARAAPGPLSQWFLGRADELGAAKATFEARRDGPPLPGPLSLDFLKADGEVAGSRFALMISHAPAPVDAVSAQASLDSPDAGALLRRLGASVPAGAAGRAQLSLDATGQWDRGFQGKARLQLAGADFVWSGALSPDGPRLQGPLTLKSADLFPALATLGLATAGTGLAAPADLAADLDATANGAQFTKLTGSLAGSRVGGDLDWAPLHSTLSLDQLVAMAEDPEASSTAAAAPPAISGALTLDRANLGGLLSLALGRPGPVRPGAVWPELKFGPALLTPPSTDVNLKIDALDLGVGVGRAAAAQLRMDRDRLALDGLSANLGGGEAGGRLELRRDKSQATAVGALSLHDVAFDRGGVHVRLDGSTDFAGVGETPAALIGALAGAGQARIAEAKWPRLDPLALVRAYAKIEQAQGPPADEKKLEALVGAELDRAPLALADERSAVALSGGVAHFGPWRTPDGADVSGALDLADLSLSAEATLAGGKVGPFWSGPSPTVDVVVRSDGSPRRIDASLLSAELAAEAVARENDRIANFEADVRERAMFNRRYKADRFLARRDEEIAAFQDAQERQRLMQLYLGPYTAFAASHGEPPPPSPRPKDATASGTH